MLVLRGSVRDLDEQKREEIERILRKISGDPTLTIEHVDNGSIRLTLKGSRDAFKVISALVARGEIKDVLGLEIERIELQSSSGMQNVPVRGPETTMSAEGKIARGKCARDASPSKRVLV